MTDDLHAWLNERETIHGKATDGPWVYTDYGVEAPEPPNPEDRFDVLADVIARTELKHEDTLAIVDAHNTLPRLLAGVKAVRNTCIAAHLPDGKYGDYGQGYNKALSDVMSAVQEAIGDE